MSSGNQPQFRYTQPPSKVLHIRNLPWEVSEEELIELCKAFGRVVNTKLNVGTNHNQAFVEFESLNHAIAMVSYYASSNEPAQVRGKAVYLQYSTRQEIVTSKNSGDVASNVLLVTIEGVDNGDVSIDVLHVVFSAFGFVHKIATFEKSAGFQALVQFGDATTATTAKSALEGRSIPRYLLSETVGNHSLKINYSAHNDLNVKFQSHRSRDYTNPYLPVAPSATDGVQAAVGSDGKRKEPESNVLLVSIDNMTYAVTLDVLHTVFSAFGTVQKIAIFEKQAGFQALVQYPDVPTAVAAKDALEGHCIYDGGFCKLRLSYSRHTDLNVKANNDRSRDYTNPNLPAQPLPQPPPQQQQQQAPQQQPQQQQQQQQQQQSLHQQQQAPPQQVSPGQDYSAYLPPQYGSSPGVMSSPSQTVAPARPGFEYEQGPLQRSGGGPPAGPPQHSGTPHPGAGPPPGPPGPPPHSQGQFSGPPMSGPPMGAQPGPPGTTPQRGPPGPPPHGMPAGYGPPPMNVGGPGPGGFPGPGGPRGGPPGPGGNQGMPMHQQGPPHMGPPSHSMPGGMGMGPPGSYGPPIGGPGPQHAPRPGGPPGGPPQQPYAGGGGYM